MPLPSLRTQVGHRPTVAPKPRDPGGWTDGALVLRTGMATRPGSRSLDLSPRDGSTLSARGFPVDRELAQPREWVGRVEGADEEGWWLHLAEVPSGVELSAWVPASAFEGCVPVVGLPVLVRTWLEWMNGAWEPRQAVVDNRRA